MYKGYIFDLDGTLLNTLDDLKNAVNATMRAFGYKERTLAETCAFVGNGMRVLIQRATDFKAENVDEMLNYLKTYYGAHCEEETKPYEGIISMLQRLLAEGKRMAIVSNKADFAVKQLTNTYFKGLIDVAIGENEEAGVKKKPAPDSLYVAIEKLGLKKEECVYIGDSEVDIQTAQNAGLNCILVTWGFRDKEYLKGFGGEVFVDYPNEIFLL